MHGQSSQLKIDGEVINDPTVLNAVKALNINNILKATEAGLASEALAFEPKASYSQEMTTLANKLEELQDQYLRNLGAWESTITKRSSREGSAYENIEKTVSETPRGQPLNFDWSEIESQTLAEKPINQPLFDAL